MIYVTQSQLNEKARAIAEILSDHPKCNLWIYPVPRGGVPAAYLIQAAFYQHFGNKVVNITNDPEAADVIVDDLIDSGRTQEEHTTLYLNTPFYALINKKQMPGFRDWVVFPWEASEETDGGEDIPTRLLQYIGEDSERGGLIETPKRFLKAWKHYTSGYDKEPSKLLKVFEDGAEDYDEMVLVRDIPVYSQCEHHLAPFFGVAHVGYIPSKSIVGLSKLSRLVDMFARRLQVQERLTSQIADALNEHLKPQGVAVVLECRHMCMESRGICQQGHKTITSAMRGALKDKPEARAEFMGLIK